MNYTKDTHILSKDEAEQLLFEYKKSGDKELLEKIVLYYRYIPELLSRRYSHRGAEFDDVYQIACIGLLNAIERFDENKGIKFVTYATPTIIGEIKRFFRDKGYFIKVPRKIYEIFQKASRLRAASGKKLSSTELADAIGVTEEQLNYALSWGDTQFVRSLEQFVYSDDNDKTFTDVIGVEDNHFLMIENTDFIGNFLKKLSESEKNFVTEFFNSPSIFHRLNHYSFTSAVPPAAVIALAQQSSHKSISC